MLAADDDADFSAYAAEAWARLYRRAFLLAGHHADAEDLAQQTLIRARRHWAKVVSAGSPDAYVTRILTNDRPGGAAASAIRACTSLAVCRPRRPVISRRVPRTRQGSREPPHGPHVSVPVSVVSRRFLSAPRLTLDLRSQPGELDLRELNQERT